MQENNSKQKEFNFEDYLTFVEGKIEKLSTRKTSFTKDEVLAYCSQFDIPAKDFFIDTKPAQVSEKLRRIFGSSLINKPKAVHINTYFLFSFGFIHCNVCRTIKNKNDFFNYATSWHGYKHYCKDCQKNNRDLEDNRQYMRNNRDKYSFYLSLYRSKKLKATPKWLTEKHLNKISEFYTSAKELSNDTLVYEVDHIIPLQGNNVCGLHVPWNLQILERSENRKKSNKY